MYICNSVAIIVFHSHHLFMKLRFGLYLPLVAIVACTSEQIDSEAPEFTQVTINSSEEEQTVQTGTVLNMNMTATDDESVAQIKIDIHEAFDGHDHGKREQSSWTYVNILNTNGPAVNVSDSPTIPAEVASGPYHAVFRVLDDNGNEGAFIEREIVIENGSQPMIQVNSPSDNDSFTLGQTITPTGAVNDPDGLKEVHLVLLHIEDHHAHAVDEQEEDLTTSPTSFDLSSMQVTIPTDEEPGAYKLLVKAVDVLDNHTLHFIDLTVTQ